MVKGNRVKVRSEKDLKELRKNLEVRRRSTSIKESGSGVVSFSRQVVLPWYQPKISFNWCSLAFFGGLGGSLLICWLIQ